MLNVRFKLISGPKLCPDWRKCCSVTVEISTYGIRADTSTKLTAEVRLVEALCHFRSLMLQSRDAFWPQWRLTEKVYSMGIIMPVLVGGVYSGPASVILGLISSVPGLIQCVEQISFQGGAVCLELYSLH